MRVRSQDQNGDMQFGQGSANFLVNSAAAVGQLLGDRLGLWTGEWFVDQSDGVPWSPAVLGTGTAPSRDPAIKTRILRTTGVTAIDSYASSLAASRAFTAAVTVDTSFSGQITVPFGPGPARGGSGGQLDFEFSENSNMIAGAG